ncbi:uncharacterized protein PHACADRAFT_203666 [Phanerochaete carnosa HHB-10118-sp]|nr:uncharacterized protein PHACADRAFT_203666 [Phanerochaete carnosa HHB-10118-sp]EKM60465.1 hypothetical protein PHACADRAFT_203666 [Phanerochaete carnosa HHB-10118-sp]
MLCGVHKAENLQDHARPAYHFPARAYSTNFRCSSQHPSCPTPPHRRPSTTAHSRRPLTWRTHHLLQYYDAGPRPASCASCAGLSGKLLGPLALNDGHGIPPRRRSSGIFGTRTWRACRMPRRWIGLS